MGLRRTEVLCHVAACVACSLLLTACTSVSVRVPDPEIPRAQTRPIPDKVGIYLAPELRQFEVDEVIMPDTGFRLRTDLGPANQAMFESILATAFPNGVQVKGPYPDELTPVVLMPTLTGFDYVFNAVNARTEVEVVYRLAILKRGQGSFTVELAGQYAKDPGPGLGIDPIWSAAPRNIQDAIRNAGTKLVLLLHDAAGTDEWLAELEKHALDEKP